MKKKVFSLMMTLLLAFVGIARADVLTVNDGSTTNSYVPVYGFYADSYLKCEFVQPAADLADIAGGTINGLTFYSSSTSVSWGSANFQVFMAEVSSSSISAFNGPGTVVYDGALSISSNGEMNVTFTTPYNYNGGNLLIGVYNTAEGSYVSSSWYGVDATGASVQGYSYTSLGDVNPSQRNFLPKMAIDYTPGGTVVEAELTVHDGTSTNSYVPFYGLWVDDYTRSEMIYSASELSDMAGGDINAMTFFKSGTSTTSSWGSAIFQVYLKEVTNTTLSSYIGMTGATIVYEGAVDAAGGEREVTINFTTPYHYNGGNLLVGIYETTTGDYSSAYWYGESVTGVSASGYNGSDPASASFNQRDFMPKTRFDYTYMAPEVEIVDAIEINGFVAPVWGGSLPVDNTYIPEDANYTVVESGWESYHPGRGETKAQARAINPEEIVNDPELAYYMYFRVVPNEGYGFNNSTVAYLNGDANMWDEDYTSIEQDYAQLVTIDIFAYEDGLHTLSTYGVGDNQYESVDRLLIERPNGAWMEPFHFQLYNDGTEDVDVRLIDFLHTNHYFSMVEDDLEYPFTVEATGRDGAVDLYMNTNIDWTATDEINSLIAVNTNERSTHLYPIIAAPYEPYCPDVWEKAYPLGNVTDGTQWSMTTEEMWMEQNPEPEYELHNNYHMPFTEDPYNIADGKDAVIKFTVDRAMMLNAWVSGAQSATADAENAKVALYTEDFSGRPGPMAYNNYTERPFEGLGGGGTSGSTEPFNAMIGEEESSTTFSYMPFYTLYNYSIAEALYLPEELTGAGVTSAPMTSLSWYANNAPGYAQQGISIWMANVEDTELTTTSHVVTGMTLVYTGSMTPAVGWNEFVFNQGNFAWDGHSSVLIYVQRNNGSWNSTVNWRAQNAGFNASAYRYQDSGAYDATVAQTMYNSTSRSIIKMTANGRGNRDAYTYGFENGLEGWTALDVNVDGGTWIHSNSNLGQYDYTELAHGGSGFAMCYSFVDYDGAYDTDSYLISPQQYTLDNNSSITFWADNANDSYPESFSVCVSTAATPTANSFTEVWGGSAKANNAAGEQVRHIENHRYDNWRSHTVDLSAYAGQTVWIAFHDVNYDAYEIWIDDVTINAASSTPVDPEPEPEFDEEFSAGPVIHHLNILPGTYYLVASATEDNYRVNINVEDLPCPEQSIAVYPPDNADGIEPNSVTLRWHLSPFCTEYRLVFSTMYWPDDNPDHPQTIIIDWTDQLAESYTVTNLWNNTNYFWRVDQRTNGGEEFDGCTTIGNVFGFTTHLNVPQNLIANPEMIFEGETSTLTWNPVVDRTYRYYYIYKDGERIGQTPVNQINANSFVVPATELEYNMEGYVFNVAAVYDEGISDFSNDAIVKVSGYSNTTGINGYVYEQDGTTPIEGATITLTGTDEFGNSHTYHPVTDANGYYSQVVYVGHYTVALANKDGYQQAETVHEMPFDVEHLGQVDGVNFIMNEIFYAPAHVCAEEVFVENEIGDSLVHIWWDFDFYDALIEDFEDFENTPFDWTLSAQYPWTVTTTDPYEGAYCLKSGGAGVASVTSDMIATVDVPNDGFISFYVKPSCENGWDYGYFYIDGNQMGSFTGQGTWSLKKYPITEGNHTFRWSYQKDGSVNSYDDCIYIDYITFNEQPEPAIAGTTYNFDDSSMQGWTSLDADGDGYGWYVASEIMSTGYGHDGSNDCVLSQSYSNGAGILYPDNYFVSPQVALGGVVRFYACAQDASYAAEHFGVAVSTTNNTSASAFTMLQEWTMTAKRVEDNGKLAENSRSGRAQGSWYEYTVDLSAYAGQNGYVAIRHFNCYDMFYLDVDDITISDPNREVAEEGNRSLHHFRIYRTDCYNDGPYTSENTELLASAWMPDFEYWDVSWPYAEPGVYKYGVSAVYDGNREEEDDEIVVYPALPRESEIVWSNLCGPCIDKDMYLDTLVTVNVILNSLDSPEGTVVTFVNTNEGEQYNHPMDPITLDQTGHYVFPHFRKGNYNITVEHEGYFTYVDYQEIWSATDLRYVLVEKIHNVKDLYVSRTGWAMWEPGGVISNPEDSLVMPERHLEGYKVMCEGVDHEPIFNVNTPYNFCQVATDQLVEGERYVCKVAAIYSTGMSDFEQVEWMYEPCENYGGTVNGVISANDTISWEYPGGGQVGPGEASTFTQDFEDGLGDWTVVDANNDGWTWCLTSAIPTTWTYYESLSLDWYHSGTNAVCSGSYINGVGAVNPDEYLVSPQVTLAEGSQLSFWVAATDAGYPADHFGVFVSNTGTEPGDFTSVQEWTLAAKVGGDDSYNSNGADNFVGSTIGRDNRATRLGTWYNYTVDLSEFAGEAYIAFRHFNCYDQYIMCLDDVELINTNRPNRDPWDLMMTFEAAEGGHYGVAYDGENFYTSNWGYSGTTHNFYKYDLDGNMIEGFEIPGCGTLRGMTYDGTYFYGVANSSTVYCVDLANHAVISTFTSAYGAMRGITYEPVRDGFWVIGNWSGNLTLIDRTGAIVQVGPEPESASDLAYYMDDNDVEHIFCFDNIDSRVYDYNITTNTLGTTAVFDFTTTPGYDGGSSGGCTVGAFNGKMAFIGDIQQSPNLIGVYELSEAAVEPEPVDSDILGAMVFVDGEWVTFVEYPTNYYLYDGNGDVCIRLVYDGTAQLPDNNFYYAMSCEECAVALEPENCPAGDPIYADVNSNDQVHIWWGADRSDKVVKYNVYRSTDNASYSFIGEVAANRSGFNEYFDVPGEGTFYYQVTAVYSSGCESEPAISGIDPTVNYVVVGVTGLNDLAANVNLFPNPTSSNITIQAQGMQRITVVSVLGQVVFDTELTADEFTMNMSQFNAGMYLVRVYTENGMAVKRVTVMQ